MYKAKAILSKTTVVITNTHKRTTIVCYKVDLSFFNHQVKI